MKYPEEKREGEKEMAKKAIMKDHPMQMDMKKEMRKRAAKRKLRKMRK